MAHVSRIVHSYGPIADRKKHIARVKDAYLPKFQALSLYRSK